MKYLPSIVVLTILSACAAPDRHSDSNAIAHTPQALKDVSEIKSFSKRSGENVIENLYQEEVAKSAVLRELESGISTLQENKLTTLGDYGLYEANVREYYEAAEAMTGTFKDSLLKRRTRVLLTESSNRHQAQKSHIDHLIAGIEGKDSMLLDVHLAMKILRTLPVIEQYEKQHLPARALFQEILRQQQVLILRMDSIIANK